MPFCITVRPLQEADFEAWLPLWEAYNSFYGREGPTALDPAVTKATWARFFDPNEPVFALVAEAEGKILGLTHFLHHRSTTRIELTCYLQDLFTVAEARGQGIGRALIEAVYSAARNAGSSGSTGKHTTPMPLADCCTTSLPSTTVSSFTRTTYEHDVVRLLSEAECSRLRSS